MDRDIFEDFSRNLLKITSECRLDMHEPDEQGITARVLGTRLDNAMGNRLSNNFLINGWQEMVVVIEHEDNGTEQFNLASLIAMARYGASKFLEEPDTSK